MAVAIKRTNKIGKAVNRRQTTPVGIGAGLVGVPKNASGSIASTTVAFVYPALADLYARYWIIRDCIAGEQSIKLKQDAYLPRPNATDVGKINQQRYRDYLLRAVWYGITKNTLDGLVGMLFTRNPVIECPDVMDAVKDDATGANVSITQLAKSVATNVCAYGRCGILIDYPRIEGVTTLLDQKKGTIRPTISYFDPWSIINWRTTIRGGKQTLCLVVIFETPIADDDGFEFKTQEQWRVLRLSDDNIYTQEIWRRVDDKSDQFYQYTPPFAPLDGAGKSFEFIPFTFVGAVNNDSNPDAPPMYDIASLNIAHFRNSADYEESVFLIGQPTPVLTGLTENWVSNVLGGVVMLGSRSAIMLPVGAEATLLQAEPNSLVFESMQHKEQQMVALGAKLIQDAKVQRTATEVSADNHAEQSTLSNIGANVSAALLWAMQVAAQFMNITSTQTNIKFVISNVLDQIKMSPEERRQLLEEMQLQGISWTEYRAKMRAAGIATLDDVAALTEIKADSLALPGLHPDLVAKQLSSKE